MNTKLTTPNVPFYKKTWFKSFAVIAILGWTILKVAVIYLVNNYGGVVINHPYDKVFIIGLLPIYLVIYAISLIVNKKWKWIFSIGIIVYVIYLFIAEQ